jgi:hypothetical protein
MEEFYWSPVSVQDVVDCNGTNYNYNKTQHGQYTAGKKYCCLIEIHRIFHSFLACCQILRGFIMIHGTIINGAAVISNQVGKVLTIAG